MGERAVFPLSHLAGAAGRLGEGGVGGEDIVVENLTALGAASVFVFGDGVQGGGEPGESSERVEK